MNNMKLLYQKVAADSDLQQQFAEITQDSETEDKEATEAKLTEFARKAGFEITIEEMSIFFAGQGQETDGELSEADLDMVAGGKTVGDVINVVILSAITCIVGCIAASDGKYGTTCDLLG